MHVRETQQTERHSRAFKHLHQKTKLWPSAEPLRTRNLPAAMATFEAFGMSLTDRATMFNSCAVWGTKN